MISDPSILCFIENQISSGISMFFEYVLIFWNHERLKTFTYLWKYDTHTYFAYITDMPMGQVPILEIDGKKYHQSRAIARYVAKKCNLYGSNEIEALEIDGIVDSLDDMRQSK